MQIILNGEPREFTDNITLSDLVAALGFTGMRYAIEVEGAIVPRSQHATTTLIGQQRVEIIQAVGGG